MNNLLRSSCSASALLLVVSSLAAQDFFVGTRDPVAGTSTIFRVSPTGVQTPITFVTSASDVVQPFVQPGNAVSFEADLRDSNVLIIAERDPVTTEVGIFRTQLGSSSVLAQQMLFTIPGTAGTTPYAGDMRRAPDGSFVLLSRNLNPTTSLRLDRLMLTRQGGVFVPIPVTLPPEASTMSITEIAVDDLGTIFMTGPNQSTPLVGRILSLAPTGGAAMLFAQSNLVNFWSVEVMGVGILAGGGQGIGGSPTNFAYGIGMGGSGAAIGVGPIGATIPPVTDLHRDENGDVLMAISTTHTFPTIERFLVGPPPTTSIVASFTQTPRPQIVKVTRDYVARSPQFGGSGPRNSSNLPRCLEGAQPFPGGIWSIDLRNGVPSGANIISIGFAELPSPVDLTGLGSPGSALFQSNEITASNVSNGVGNATLNVAIPSTAVSGTPLFAQYGVLTSFHPLGFCLTNAIHTIVQ